MPDRYSNPENAEEATIAAALASEDAAPIDETVEEVTVPQGSTDAEISADDQNSGTETSGSEEVEPAAEENGEDS